MNEELSRASNLAVANYSYNIDIGIEYFNYLFLLRNQNIPAYIYYGNIATIILVAFLFQVLSYTLYDRVFLILYIGISKCVSLVIANRFPYYISSLTDAT